MSEPIKVTINGQEFDTEKGARLIDVCNDNGFGIPSFCYYKDLALQASCRMCLVRIEKMPKLQTSCTITCTDGMNRHDAERRDRKGAARDGRISAGQSSARLSGLRPRRRVRIAGSHFRLGRCRRAFYRKEKRPAGKISVADRRQRSATLHRLQTLHARLRRMDGRRCDRSGKSRREHGHRNLRRLAQLFAMRKLHRSLPDRNSARRHLSSRNPTVGIGPDDYDRYIFVGRNAAFHRFARRTGSPNRRARPLCQRT